MTEERIVGFDTGSGLPEVRGHKDHPELWSAGDFAMPDRDKLVAKSLWSTVLQNW